MFVKKIDDGKYRVENCSIKGCPWATEGDGWFFYNQIVNDYVARIPTFDGSDFEEIIIWAGTDPQEAELWDEAHLFTKIKWAREEIETVLAERHEEEDQEAEEHGYFLDITDAAAQAIRELVAETRKEIEEAKSKDCEDPWNNGDLAGIDTLGVKFYKQGTRHFSAEAAWGTDMNYSWIISHDRKAIETLVFGGEDEINEVAFGEEEWAEAA